VSPGVLAHHLRNATFVLESADQRVLMPADGEALSTATATAAGC
jgi:hypothetical protein